MEGYDGSSTLVAPGIAVTVVDVLPGQFGSLTFGVSSYSEGQKPEVCVVTTSNKYPSSV